MHILLSLLFAAAPLFSQDLEKDAQKPSREKTQAVQDARLSAEAAQRAAPGEGVTLEQVLADPDNVQLNYRYALVQIRRGDVKSAAATLERILLVDPKQHEVRLLYAVVLFRLDNMVEAKRELDILKKAGLPPALREEADKYAKAVEQRNKKTHLSGSLNVGFEYDTNRNAAPATGRRLLGDTPVNLTGSSRRRDDTSLILMAGAAARRDLPYQALPEAFASFTYYQSEQTLAKSINLKAYSVQAGATLRAGRAKLTPSLLFDHVQLAQSTFLRNRGAAARLDYRLSPKASLFMEAKDVYQEFVPTRDVASAFERTGSQIDLSAGSEHVLGTAMKFGTVVGYTRKNAARKYFTFDRAVAGISHQWLLGKGTFLASAFNVNYDLYAQPDTAISRSFRKDTSMRLSETFGAPLSLVHKSLKDLMWTFSYEYYHALSNLENYAYTNNKIATMLSYRWEVGL